MPIDRNTRPEMHRFRFGDEDLDLLRRTLSPGMDGVLSVAWHQIANERVLPEASRIAVWQRVAHTSLAPAFKDYHLDWERIEPAVERVRSWGLVPDGFWNLGRARYRVPGGEFYDRGYYDLHLPTAEVHGALYEEFLEDGLAEWDQRGGRRFLRWDDRMWVHSDRRRLRYREPAPSQHLSP